MKVVGLMSGTSMDGIDAALLEVTGEGPDDPGWSLLAFVSLPYRDEQRDAVLATVDRGDPAALTRLHADLGLWFAEAARAVCAEAGVSLTDVAALGSHGHTVWHEPPRRGSRGATLQLGDPATLAEATGVAVVSDFRSADVAAGGHGAPLVAWPDRVLFAHPERRRALQNLGGIANVTWLPSAGSEEPPLAFDTGPGNVLLDVAAARATGGRLRCDEEGRLASSGRVDPDLLDRLRSMPFFACSPPKSTGRELFGPTLVDRLVRERGLPPGEPADPGWSDLLATLTALTATTVADAIRRWVEPRGLDEVALTGGGSRNPALVAALHEALTPIPIVGAQGLPLDPRAREAAAFALLAWAHLCRVPGNVPGSTGANGPRVLGSWTPSPGRATPPGGAPRGPAA